MNVITFLRSFQNSPLFANLAIHAWLAAFLVSVALGKGLHLGPVIAGALALAALKEFWFDHRYEIPPQPYANAAQDFAGYVIGIALGVGAWLA